MATGCPSWYRHVSASGCGTCGTGPAPQEWWVVVLLSQMVVSQTHWCWPAHLSHQRLSYIDKKHTKKTKVNLCNSNDIRLKKYWLNNDKVDPVITVTWCHTDLPRGWWGKRKDMMLLYFHSWMPDPAPFRFFTKSSFSLFHIALQVRTESKKRDGLPQQSPM